jgi:hypothetical protein
MADLVTPDLVDLDLTAACVIVAKSLGHRVPAETEPTAVSTGTAPAAG